MIEQIKVKPKHAGGRPSKYTKAIANEICLRLAHGQSLNQICRDDHMPWKSTVLDWMVSDREGFYDQYARARVVQAEHMFDEIIDIADDGSNDWMEIETKSGRILDVPDHEHINRSRLRVDSRKWYLSKVLPKKYGDKQMVEHSGSINWEGLVNDINGAETRNTRQMQSIAVN